MKNILLLVWSLALVTALPAELTLPAIIGDHMVLQQKQANPFWGWDTPGTKVTVEFAGKTYAATAGADGKWTVKLAADAANATPQIITIAGTTTRTIQDVLVGEVWMCSGQSNMQFRLAQDWNGDLEAATANLPNLRLITVPSVGTQELQADFKGQWSVATTETAKSFSAIGLLYGRYLQQALGVPVGLINNAWGGSAAEAWIRRETMEKDPRFSELLARIAKREAALLSAEGQAGSAQAMAAWKVASERAKLEKKAAPGAPGNWLTGNARPGNIFAGVIHPTLGYGMKGVIWYQGEANAGRAHEYAELFPFMIEQWRQEWQQGDFSFYWVQLADFMAEKSAPGASAWAELRESQTKTLRLPNTGQAVIIDLGEGKDIHPRNKHDVAARLVRWALVKDYGLKLPYRSPEYKTVAIAGNKATVTLDCFGSTLRAFDVAEARGFAVCGADRVWQWARGKIVAPDRVEVWSDAVAAPIAVRYAWADNPVCNLFSNDGLPVTPFRTDDFVMTTKLALPLIEAAARGDAGSVKQLLAQGAPVTARDDQGRTALLAATHGNQIEVAGWLIAAGSDVNAKDILQDSPFLYAGAEGRLEILRLTLAAGADLKSTNRFGGTALIPACEKGHVENVRELLGTNIAVDHINNLGWTALLETAMKKNRGPAHAEITRLLLAAGANPNLADRNGVTPLAHARQAGNQAIAELLQAVGGR